MGSSAKVSNYITKYITKDVDEVVEKGKKTLSGFNITETTTALFITE